MKRLADRTMRFNSAVLTVKNKEYFNKEQVDEAQSDMCILYKEIGELLK